MHPDLERVPDDLPRDSLLCAPLTVVSLTAAEPEARDDGSVLVTFRLTVKDAEGKRCPELAVHATLEGPERTASGMGRTDLMGTVRFQMAGPAGRYRLTVDDVAAGALALDRDGSVLTAELRV
jgi:hypothetical protein